MGGITMYAYLSKPAQNILFLDGAVNYLRNCSNLEFAKTYYYIDPWHSCAECGKSSGQRDRHHIKPVWACALQLIINLKPQSKNDLREIELLARDGRMDIYACNHPANIRRLCRSCHSKADTVASRYWKGQFQTQGIMFTHQELDECLRRLRTGEIFYTLPGSADGISPQISKNIPAAQPNPTPTNLSVMQR